FATTLSVMTERSVNGPLAIRLEGEVIAEPTVFERIDGGQVQVTGPDLPKLKRLAHAAKGQCKGSGLAIALQPSRWPIDVSATRAAMPRPLQRGTKPA
ncbi:MAG TPA: hypothetical protein VFS49_11455, partial [Croceibacterium sp.]|nr:hypothetical protein [Croceibacterium sp.]